MIFPTLPLSAAKALVSELLEGSAPSTPLENLARESGVLPRGEMTERISTLNRGLTQLVDSSDGSSMAEFDANASVLCHESLGALDVRTATDAGFWRYLAAGPLYEVVRWRYPDSRNPENFGIGSTWEALPARLWFRAHLIHDSSHADPYRLARRGGVDFWISGLIRVLYSSNPELSRALVEFQFPSEGRFIGDRYSPATLSTDGIRELYKRLQHLTSTTEFVLLDADQAKDLIESLAADLPRSND